MKGSFLLAHKKDFLNNLKLRGINLKLIALLFVFAFYSCGGGESDKKESEKKTQVKIKKKEQTPSTQVTDNQTNNSLGKRVFILCASCHNLKKDEPHKVGPNLYGIFNRKAATNTGFKYSEALTNSGIIWNKETMTKWIENPDQYIPGSNMAFVGVKNKKQQEAVIDYIMELTKNN